MRAALSMVDYGARVASGPSDMKAADELRKVMERRDLWPYPWVYPPPDSIRRNPAGAILAPVASDIILTFQVPQGFQYDLQGVMFGIFTTNMLAVGNPGDFTFSVTKNQPQTGTVLQGVAIADFLNFPFPLGSPLQRPFPLPRSENFGPTDVIRVEVTNVSGTAGAPNYALAMLAGWLRKA